jgi:UDP-N-acetylmuramate dehydrogenase
MLGLGSNLLVRDRGFSGVVIKLTQLNQLSIDKGVIQVDAGVTLAKLSRFCGSQDLNGAEFLSAIHIKIGCWLFFKKSDNALSVSGIKKSCAMPPTLNEQCLAIGWL